MGETPAYVVTGLVVLAVLLAGYASWVVVRAHSYSRGSKLLQLAIVWLVPVIGPVLCVAFARADSAAARTTSPEFYENVDASGSDH